MLETKDVTGPEGLPASGGGVGERRERVDARGRVVGSTVYTADEAVGTAIHVAVHRSTRPHARIVGIDTTRASASPSVVSVVTGSDLHDLLGDRIFTGPAFSDQPCLAVDKVRYVGEPVAAVLATDLAAARKAAEDVEVDYEDLPPVYDVADALEIESFVHDELRPAAVFGDLRHLSGVRDTNVCYEYRLRDGDAEDVRESSPTTVSASFWCPPTHHAAIELPCTVAWVEGDRLELLTTTQTPSYVRQAVADLLDLPLSRVRVRTRPLGGGFGAKMYDRLEPLAAALAWTQRTKVRVVATREEAFVLTTRHGAGVEATMSADSGGNITSATADIVYDTGAYADVGPRITAKSGLVAAGPYAVPNVDIRSRCVYTNKPSAGPFRGFGVPQVTWSHESLIDELAHAHGESPYTFRRRNLLREGDVAPVGTPMHSADLVSCLDAVADAIGWHDELDRGQGRWKRGRGLAVGIKAVLTPTISNAVLQLNQDASASLLISTVEMGQGSDTIMSQIAAEVLCIDSRMIRVVAPDTDVTPYDTITAGSRSTYHTGNAVRLVAEAMRDRLLKIAASQLELPVEELELTPGGVVSARGSAALTISQLVHAHYGARGTTLTEQSSYATDWMPYDKATGRSEKVTEHWFAGAVGVQLRVDTATGRVRLEDLAVAGDVGRAVNPALVEQQLAGAAITGIGHALFDELVLDQGQLLNGTMLDYQVPSVRDLPERLTPIIVESPHRGGPFGAKGVGETGILGVAPAIANAVRDAVGVRITRLPLTPERVLAAMDEVKA